MTITLYQAGAGSGKTYTITQEIVHRLARGDARPERILATTFTRKAAAELKDRIQTRLLQPEAGDPDMPLTKRLAMAEAVDQSLIGTVHSVGHQVLARYAIRLGISPQLEPIEEKAQERHLRLIMAEMPREGLRELDRLARRLGIEKPQELVLSVVDQKRGNAINDDDFRDSMTAGTERLIEVISGGTSVALPDFDGFYDACRDALQRVEGNLDETKATKKATQTLQDLVRASLQEWQAWGKVAKLGWAKKSEDSVQALTTLARRANVHEVLHADLRAFTQCLIERCLEIQGRYRQYKATHGLVDFTDLEERFLEVLGNEEIAQDLAKSLDLVVVDEFQDTNPIQLAIFQALAELAPASLWVGDEKQAIYGFRGTDAALMRDVLANVPEESRKTLPKNWRSQQGLVEAVNKIFEPIFGPGTSLDAEHHGPSRIERWKLQGKNKGVRKEAFLAQMQELVEDESPGDIAVLVRKNDEAKDLAAGLADIGVPAQVQTAGLLSTREGAVLLAGIRLVADQRDRLAAAIIRTVEDDADTPAWFPAAVKEPESVLDDPLIQSVTDIDARSMPPSGVVSAVIQALQLPDRIASWGRPGTRSAHLDELVNLGQRYEDEAEQEGKAATLTGLIYWLEDLKGKEEDLLPLPAGVDAVRIMTLHAAKGLEWPVVVLFQDGSPPDPHPFRIHVEGGQAREGRPLDGRAIRYWPYPFGTSLYGGLNADGSGIQDAAKQSPEGVSLQDRHMAETRRLLYVGFTRARRSLILAEAPKTALSMLDTLNDVLPKDHEFEGKRDSADYIARTCDGTPEYRDPAVQEETWFEPANGTKLHVARYWSPSKAEPVECDTDAQAMPGPHPLPEAVRTDDWTTLGEAVHAHLAAQPALDEADEGTRLRHAQACLDRWGRGGDIEAEALVAVAARLREWTAAVAPGASWHVELPVTRARKEGGQWAGSIDLALDADDGQWVIDHKSVDIGEQGWSLKASQYSGQLLVYGDALTGSKGSPVKLAVHLPLGGGMVEVRVQEQL